MASIAPHTGSKKKTRRAERDARRVRAVKRELGAIYELARLIKTEEELDTYLAGIPDEATRAETRKVLEPFLLFELTGASPAYLPPEKTTRIPAPVASPFNPLPLAVNPLRIREP